MRVHQFIEPQQLTLHDAMGDLLQVALTALGTVEPGTEAVDHTPVAKDRLDLLLDGDQLMPQIDVMPSGGLEDGPMVALGLVNVLELAQPQQPAKFYGVQRI